VTLNESGRGLCWFPDEAIVGEVKLRLAFVLAGAWRPRDWRRKATKRPRAGATARLITTAR